MWLDWQIEIEKRYFVKKMLIWKYLMSNYFMYSQSIVDSESVCAYNPVALGSNLMHNMHYLFDWRSWIETVFVIELWKELK